jgi:hypothetical protein
MSQVYRSLLILLGLLLCIGTASAQTPSTPTTHQPDVEIVAFALASGQTQMSFAYPHAVPHAQAERDLQALAAASGWQPEKVKITDSLPPVSGVTQKMTAVEFTVTGGIDTKAGTLAIQPFAQAFQSYPHISMTYVADPSFQFHGLQEYHDSHVQVTLVKQGSTYTYQIFLNSNGVAGQPIHVPDTQGEAAASPAPRTSPWIIALIILAAAGTGILVYKAMARAGQPTNVKLNPKGKNHAGTP